MTRRTRRDEGHEGKRDVGCRASERAGHQIEETSRFPKSKSKSKSTWSPNRSASTRSEQGAPTYRQAEVSEAAKQPQEKIEDRTSKIELGFCLAPRPALAALFLATVLAFLPGLLDAQAPTPPDDARYAASSQGRVYYWIGCESRWGRLKRANLLFFGSAEEAEAQGYTPSRSAGCGRRDPGPLGVPAPAEAEHADVVSGGTCVVERVVDGDTVACAGGERVRLLLIDTPELSQAPYGRLARAALLRLLPPGTAARVELDVQHRDRYGRVLAHLRTPDGRLVTEEMVRQGWAVVSVYPPNVRHVERFRDLAAQARRDGRGLWAAGGFDCLPGERRRGVCE